MQKFTLVDVSATALTIPKPTNTFNVSRSVQIEIIVLGNDFHILGGNLVSNCCHSV